MVTRTDKQAQASRVNGCNSAGPTTIDGLSRAALNSTRHGIRARRVLLDGETVETYEREAEVWVAGLEPKTDAETEVVLDVVDVRVRLGRIDKAEKLRIAATTMNALAETPQHQRLKVTRDALTLLTAMKLTIDGAGPSAGARFEALFPSVRSVVDLVREVQARHEMLIPGLLQLEDAVEDLLLFARQEWPTDILQSISTAATVVSEDLRLRLQSDGETLKRIETELAQVAVPSNDPEGRRLEGYRRQLERRLQSHLDLLEQLRRLRPGGGSGSLARPVLVNLRSVPAPQVLAQG